MFVSIMAATPDNRVAKYKYFDTLGEAEAHVSSFSVKFPDAFATGVLIGQIDHWLIDMAAKTVVVDVPPPLPPPPESDMVQMFRELAPLIDPAAEAMINARFGAKP